MGQMISISELVSIKESIKEPVVTSKNLKPLINVIAETSNDSQIYPLLNSREEMIEKFPCSGEINFKVADTQVTIQKIFDYFANQNPKIDKTDGVSLDFGAWRLNVRASNTEPLLRLNIESRADRNPQPIGDRDARACP
jgi:phosphomannomutase